MNYYENNFVKCSFYDICFLLGSYTSLIKSQIRNPIPNPDQWSGKILNPKPGKNEDTVHPYYVSEMLSLVLKDIDRLEKVQRRATKMTEADPGRPLGAMASTKWLTKVFCTLCLPIIDGSWSIIYGD